MKGKAKMIVSGSLPSWFLHGYEASYHECDCIVLKASDLDNWGPSKHIHLK